jgi:hypothetical protein
VVRLFRHDDRRHGGRNDSGEREQYCRTKLTSGPKTEARVVPESEKVGMSQKISRAGVASFLLQAGTEDLYSRRGVVITG